MILICDDDTTVRTSLTLVLKRAGYEVATAANQQEAIDFVRHTCPQLILMDMNYSNHHIDNSVHSISFIITASNKGILYTIFHLFSIKRFIPDHINICIMNLTGCKDFHRMSLLLKVL